MAGKSRTLKEIIDANLQPMLRDMERAVNRLKTITVELVSIRRAICRPLPADPATTAADDAAHFSAVLQQYKVWCAARDGSAARSLARIMLIAMSIETDSVDPAMKALIDKTKHTPWQSNPEDRNAA